MRNFFKTICIVSVLISGSALAADPVILDQVPTPPESDGIGIWGAIAYSQVDQKRGIFWGADTRQEAEDTAMGSVANIPVGWRGPVFSAVTRADLRDSARAAPPPL